MATSDSPPTPAAWGETRSPTPRRFKDTGYPTEDAEDYRPGGFHPVHLDDLLDGRYRIVRKLGYGSYSTVWLGLDGQNSHPVALKVLVAKASVHDGEEIPIRKHLAKKAEVDHQHSRYVTTLLDDFELTGPNGTHFCIVSELMGPSTVSMVNELPCNQPQRFGKRSRYPFAMAKTMLKQTLESLAFLHKHNVVHGDLQPGNILFALKDLGAVGEDQLRQSADAVSPPLERLDGKKDLWGPKYLALGQSLHAYTDLTAPTVKLSDFGAAFWTDKPPPSTVTPIALRAPELILGAPFASGIDIWAFGCLVYEFITGTRLFNVDIMGDDEQEQERADDDHMQDFIDVIAPLPERLMARWQRRDKYFKPDGQRKEPPVYASDPLEVQFAREKPDTVSEDEAKVITALIRQILQYEPSRGPTAEELLRHPWFSSDS